VAENQADQLQQRAHDERDDQITLSKQPAEQKKKTKSATDHRPIPFFIYLESHEEID
jgi:hypothetical protein